jgi:hypothetical protein
MAEVRHFPQAGHHATRENVARKVAPSEDPVLSAEQYCVYNQSRARFVATGVEAVEASSSGQESRLRNLEPGTGAGLWILPCPEISPTSIRLPLDLIYLNSEGLVLAIVESFPLGGPALSGAIAGSMLVLPENTVAEGEIRIGDRLIISAPGEMKRHLQSIKETKAEAQESHASFLEQFALHPAEAQIGKAAQEAAPAQAEAQPAAALEAAPSIFTAAPAVPLEPASAFFAPQPAAPLQTAPGAVFPAPAAPREMSPAKAEIARVEEPAAATPAPAPRVDDEQWKKRVGTGNWLTRLLQPEPVDPRNNSRESLPGLIAYYFTGGVSVGHEVRDISPTGMYIVTGERWYPGTVVRVTLTDRHNPIAERSITVNAKSVRWGSDGVGLEFILEERKRGKSQHAARMELANGMDPEEVDEFLRNYKV